jgi:hypothetical protein
MTLQDLRQKGAREYRQEPTGNFTVNRNGRKVPVTVGVEYIPTVGAGRIQEQEWYRLIRELADPKLLDRIKAHCRKLAWLKTEKDLEEYSLSCLANEAYLHWSDFK